MTRARDSVGKIAAIALVLFLVVAIASPLAGIVWGATREKVAAASSAEVVSWDLLIRNTLLLCCVTCVGAIPVGWISGFVISRTRFAGRAACFVFCVVALLTPLDMQASAWINMVSAVGWTGITSATDRFLLAAWIHIVAAIPWSVLISCFAYRQVDGALEESATLVGGLAASLRYVILPSCSAALVANALLLCVIVSGEMTVTDLLQVRTCAETIYREFALSGQVSSAMLRAIPTAAIIVSLAVACCLISLRYTVSVSRASVAKGGTVALGTWKIPAVSLVYVVCTVCTVVPAFSLIKRAGTIYPGSSGNEPYFSLSSAAGSLLKSFSVAGKELVYSLMLASFAAAMTVALSLSLANLARKNRFISVCSTAAAVVLLGIPGAVLGAGVSLATLAPLSLTSETSIAGIAQSWVDSPLALVWLYLLRSFPYVYGLSWIGMRSLDPAWFDTAELAGVGIWRQLTWIAIPNMSRLIAASGIVAAVLSFGELAGTVLVAPPGLQPLIVRIFSLAHNGVDAPLAGICLVSQLVAVVGGVVCCRLLEGRSRKPNSLGQTPTDTL